ncbi:MAG: C4-dicarboxylate TRAP transporter substrate-binding protein [Eubacteriales bacterium]
MKNSATAKKTLCLLCVAALAGSMLVGCGGDSQTSTSTSTDTSGSTSTSNEGANVVFKFGHVQTNTDPINDACLRLADAIGEQTGGAITVEVYPNSEIGSNKDNLEQAARGASIMTVVDPGYMADYVPDYGIMNGPFLFKSWEDIQVLADSDWHKSVMEQASEQGIKVLASNWFFGNRHIISNKVIETPDDTKGLKIRVPSNTMWIETMKAMGANPTTLQWSEVYSGLSQGVVDAAEAPLNTLYTSKLHEAAKNIALTGHFTAVTTIATSQAVFDTLSAEQQEIMVTAAEEEGKNYSQITANDEEEWRKKLEEEGVTFNEVDTEAFREACKATYDAFPEWSEGLYDTVQEALGYK